MSKQKPQPKYTPEVRERAVRMVREHAADHPSEWAAITSIAAKIGCTASGVPMRLAAWGGPTLHAWLRQAERDEGVRAGLSTAERERLRALERENRELREANEILRKASAFFAQAERAE